MAFLTIFHTHGQNGQNPSSRFASSVLPLVEGWSAIRVEEVWNRNVEVRKEIVAALKEMIVEVYLLLSSQL
jgi:hypothetical protein